MKLSLETKPQSQWSGDLLVLPFIDKKLLSHAWVKFFNDKLGGLPKKLLNKIEFKGKAGETELIATHGKVRFDFLLVVGLGESKKLNSEALRQAAAAAAKIAEQKKAKKVLSLLSLVSTKGLKTQEIGQALAEGTLLALHRFEKFKGKKSDPSTLKEIKFAISGTKPVRELQSGLRRGQITSEGASYARDLVNTPARNKPPAFLGKEAKKIKGLRTRVFDHRQLQKMGMDALWGVGKGSVNLPVFVEMHYKPTRSKKTVAIVGKGIVFDSGGLSLKPPKGMETMKDDMAGSAAVLGVMKILPLLKPNVEVYGYVASAENMPDGAAQRPGDVVTAYNGKTIEVLNTDAEGRLALADALSYVTRHRKVDYIIDMATLTGAALVALGDVITAAMGTDSDLIAKLKAAGENCGEKIWELPLAEEYWEGFKSDVADMRNIGGMWAGTINAALFLKQFVDKKAKWAHLDIAGPSWANKPWPYCPKGGTGIMVRTLVKFFESI